MLDDKEITMKEKGKVLFLHGLLEGSVLSICGLNAHPHAVQVSVKYEKDDEMSKSYTLDMMSTDTILGVKRQIQRREGLMCSRQQMTRAGAGLRLGPEDKENRVSELSDSTTLVKLVPYGNELKLRVRNRKKCMVTLDVFCKAHLLPGYESNESNLRLSQVLSAIAWNSDDMLYVVPRSIYSLYLSSHSKWIAESLEEGTASGYQDLFGLEAAWMPYVEQTTTGMSCFLSCLFVVAHYMNGNVQHAEQICGHFRLMLTDFPPAVMSLFLLGKRN
ncbi:hypothetical protein RFI_16502 [Reticulomyxa filosa]|uniref:Ubiquitin-like domain-containing protein n=1 Tax=Reticulomyxa filosa TaxID=46433 RepID=X6N361_RETFI|nr:hypothetical protein RFI_16502 [Reticulomyxa filosa]|eukprot:ETO20715.1 hypothetical protein RFI_16502 [Reticulomyxa filosa]